MKDAKKARGEDAARELYRRFRPRRLEDLVGNRQTVATLQAKLRTGALPHVLLLSGPSGCGKTTVGRILRRELGCGTCDFAEMNMAQSRGVDTIRDVTRQSRLAPIGGKCRIFLLDECHQLTKEAQQAALKLLEDVPDHVYFVLCTTEPDRLLPTIRTRATPLPLAPLDEDEAAGLVRSVAKRAGIEVSDEVVEALVDAGQGSARALLVALDRVSSLDDSERTEALKESREARAESIELCRALIKKDRWARVAKILQGIDQEPEQVRRAVLGYARVVLLKSGSPQAYEVLRAFENHVFDSGHAGLARAAFEAVHGGDS